MDKKIIYLAATFIVIAGLYLISLNMSATQEKAGDKFEIKAMQAYNILKNNGLEFENITEDSLLGLDSSNIEDTKQQLIEFRAKNSSYKALADLASLYIILLDEIKLRKELKQYEDNVNKLSDEGLCQNIGLLDKYSEKNDALYASILKNNDAIESYVKEYPKENTVLSLDAYLEDEDIAFINYSELKGYILDMQHDCLSGNVE